MTPDEQTRFLALVEHAKATCVVKIVQRVAEIPDRTSPDDQPDIMLVTGGELGQIVSDELEALVRALGTEPETPPLLAACHRLGLAWNLSDEQLVKWLDLSREESADAS